eukprot:m.206063 g.206063  ORF g.206063 m.206063 type:complete len:155 (+) comp13754_c1_seq11:2-466(+)
MWSLSLLVLEVFYSCVGLRLFKKDPVEMLKESDDIITDEFGADDAASLDPNTHSVMKFLHVMFSARSSGSVFACEGDLLIVGDIILREIQDRAVTDLGLRHFLDFLELVALNSPFNVSQTPRLVELLEYYSGDDSSSQHIRDTAARILHTTSTV